MKFSFLSPKFDRSGNVDRRPQTTRPERFATSAGRDHCAGVEVHGVSARRPAMHVLIGTTREEMAAFESVNDMVKQADELALRGEFERLFGARGAPGILVTSMLKDLRYSIAGCVHGRARVDTA